LISKLVSCTVLLLVLLTCAWAGPITFAVDNADNLYTVDLATASKTLVGSTGQFLEGLALSPGGVLYGTTNTGILYSINTSTGAATLVGNTGLGDLEGLVFNGSTLLAVNFTSSPSTIYSLNLSTGAPTALVTEASSTGLDVAMAVLDANDVLISGNGNDTLYKVNLATGAVTNIATMADPNLIAAMSFLSNGNLYALDSTGSAFQVNPNTGALTSIGSTGSIFWLDMTTNGSIVGSTSATPEPGTLTLLGAGLALFSLRLRRSGAKN
jgi:hypothetical protein